MDTRELFIGAYVFDGTRIAQLTGIQCDGIVETTRNPQSNIELIESIPLTEEFFEKNGFEPVEPCDNFPYIVYDSKDKRIQVSDLTNNGEGYWSVHVDNEDFDTTGRCDVKYVHQFQQLLRLCGYEMNVVV